MYYAKSEPVESIIEHTKSLLENLSVLKSVYGKQITKNLNIEEERFWYLLKIICTYHDFGKVFTPFQNQIRHKLGEAELETVFSYNVKHEQLSPMFVPTERLGLNKQEKVLVYQVIFYHHERDNINISHQDIDEIIKEDILPNLNNIKTEMQIEIEDNLKSSYFSYVTERNRIKQGDEYYNVYCMLKGLLHKFDHSSSGHIKVEDDTQESIAEYTKKYIIESYSNLRELQQYTERNQEKNLLIVGSTGIGKTEGALLWSGKEKMFFTLPIRTSINAIYDRILNTIKYNHVGLLHSTAIDYLEENTEFENTYDIMEQTRNLSQKVTTCTIDQIFTFVFKYKGYEKMYSTLKYSKIIIDEIQGYSPEIVAIIIKGLQMINKLGGKFMIMTATLPRIYREELEKLGISFEYNEFIKDVDRHRIKLINKPITEDVKEVIRKAKNKKILIIVNTVDKAIGLCEKIENQGVEANLLHSRFIGRDKSKKEEKIMEFSKNTDETGIWIATQIVEASLDIDFDELYTELSTLDSLFQRLGRCYRNRIYEKSNPNVFIYTKDVSGIKYVYDEEITYKGLELLKQYDGEILTEKRKIDMVDKLYSKEMLKGTKFLKKFKEGMEILDNIIDYDTSKSDAQKLLRNIDNITVIPKSIYDKNLNLFEKYEKADKERCYEDKNKLKREIMKLTVSIRNPKYNQNIRQFIIKMPYMEDVYIADLEYSEKLGLKLKNSEKYLEESKFL